MPSRALTAKFVEALEPAADGRRQKFWDAVVPSLGVVVSPKGRKTYVIYRRIGGVPTRRKLGDASLMSLATARERAREWLGVIAEGKDPRDEARKQAIEAQRKKRTTFAAMAEDFIHEKLPHERKGREVERDIRRELLPQLGKLPVTDITEDEIAALIKAKAKKYPTTARNLLVITKRLFTWGREQRAYGLSRNPCIEIRAGSLCGPPRRRSRVLTDDELRALWRAAKKEGYPGGTVYKVLMLTGLRKNEAADAQKSEFDWRQGVWVIPAERMKGRNETARPHAVPLTNHLRAIFSALPLFEGQYLFSTTFGAKPVWISKRVKRRMDRRMLRTLKALARVRGEEARQFALPHWQTHDVRRTVRTRLSRLKIVEEVREAVLAHARPGLKATYDLHDYMDEKREALELWAAKLREIVDPPPPEPKVVPLFAKASA
jgi:integrase